jgi:hypothetical protein
MEKPDALKKGFSWASFFKVDKTSRPDFIKIMLVPETVKKYVTPLDLSFALWYLITFALIVFRKNTLENPAGYLLYRFAILLCLSAFIFLSKSLKTNSFFPVLIRIWLCRILFLLSVFRGCAIGLFILF